MAIVDSRQGVGVLMLGTKDYSAQISNVRLTPNHETEDGTKTLGFPNPAPLATTTWTLAGSAIQDWEDKTGFVRYCIDNNNTETPFEWTPNNGKAFKATGRCQVLAVELGGEIDTQSTTDFEFTVIGAITWDDTAPATAPATVKSTTTP
jgi:hypothetical protein